MKIVGFCNLKGGVGKTTACQNLAVALVRRGLKVAALDLDPQSNLTAGFGISIPEDRPYIYDFLMGDVSFGDLKTVREGVDVAPSTLDLAVVEMQLESQPGRYAAEGRPPRPTFRSTTSSSATAPRNSAFSHGTSLPPAGRYLSRLRASFTASQDSVFSRRRWNSTKSA